MVLGQGASPAGTPVAEPEAVGAILGEAIDDSGPVNVLVEVNTFVGFGSLSTGEHRNQVDETGACEAEGDAP